MLITLSREFGAGASSIAALVADRLGWHVVDNELLDEIARRAGMTVEEASARVERGPTFVDRLARALIASTPESLTPAPVQPLDAEDAWLRRITEQAIGDAATDGAVLVGRAAAAVIGRRADALHVKLVASVEYRRDVIAERFGIPAAQAESRIRDTDAHRAEYHRRWYRRDWYDPHNYHLVLNTGWLGIPGAADVIVALARSALDHSS